MPLDFRDWLAAKRAEQRLDVRSFAEMTGVDPSTITRNENKNTQTTINTAFRVCEGMNISIYQLIKELKDVELPLLEKRNVFKDSKILKVDAIENFVNLFQANKEVAAQNLVKILNHIMDVLFESSEQKRFQKRREEYKIPVSPHDIDRLLWRTPLFQPLEIEYPITIKPSTILDTYMHDGAVMIVDIENYVFRSRFDNRVNTRLPIGALRLRGRIGTGSILERTSLSDVIEFDLEAQQDGAIIGMYWEACKFYDRFGFKTTASQGQATLLELEDIPRKLRVEREDYLLRLATIYLTAYRWYQFIGESDIFPELLIK